jgi:hypothetical protein
MLTVARELVDRVRSATRSEDLFELVQNAIELEHATIPPYLTALFSLDADLNPGPAGILESIAAEEMLHMTIGCNLLNALGGQPVVNRPGFVPTYPSPLPMSIGAGLVVGLEPFSVHLVESVFLEIERPEDELELPVARALFAEANDEEFETIGEFYGAVVEKLTELGDTAFRGDPSRQVVDARWFGAERLFPVTDVASATKAIRIIVEEGEGTSESPLAGLGSDAELAHFYRFQQIVKGFELVADTTVPQGWSFSGDRIDVNAAGIHPLRPDTRLADLPQGSRAALVGQRFADSYTRLLNALQRTIDGRPDYLRVALGLMFELRVYALDCVRTPLPGGLVVGPPFELTAV